jgi:hypothetical protein
LRKRGADPKADPQAARVPLAPLFADESRSSKLSNPTGASAAVHGDRPTKNADWAVSGKLSGIWAEAPAPRSHRDLFHNLDPVCLQADYFAGMVGQQADGVQPEVGEDLGAQAAFVLELSLAVRSA